MRSGHKAGTTRHGSAREQAGRGHVRGVDIKQPARAELQARGGAEIQGLDAAETRPTAHGQPSGGEDEEIGGTTGEGKGAVEDGAGLIDHPEDHRTGPARLHRHPGDGPISLELVEAMEEIVAASSPAAYPTDTRVTTTGTTGDHGAQPSRAGGLDVAGHGRHGEQTSDPQSRQGYGQRALRSGPCHQRLAGALIDGQP